MFLRKNIYLYFALLYKTTPGYSDYNSTSYCMYKQLGESRGKDCSMQRYLLPLKDIPVMVLHSIAVIN